MELTGGFPRKPHFKKKINSVCVYFFLFVGGDSRIFSVVSTSKFWGDEPRVPLS